MSKDMYSLWCSPGIHPQGTMHKNAKSVQFSSSVVPSSLQPHGLQHARLPVHHQIPGLTQTHVHQVSDAIQPSDLLSSPSPAPNPSQHQGLFQRVISSHQVAKVSASASVLPMNIQDWLPLGWTGWISLQSKGLSWVLSNTTVQKQQFFDAQLSLWSKSHIHTEKGNGTPLQHSCLENPMDVGAW